MAGPELELHGWEDFIMSWGLIFGNYSLLCEDCRAQDTSSGLVKACECEGSVDFIYNVIKVKR